MCRFKGFAEVGDEGDGEVIELNFQALSLLIYHIDEGEARGKYLVELILALLGIVDGGVVAVLSEMACCD